MKKKSKEDLRLNYMLKSYKKNIYKDYFYEVEKYIKGKQNLILDVGCATCNFEDFYLNKNYKKNFKFYSIDSNREFIKVAKKKIKDKRFLIQNLSIKNFLKKKIKFDYILLLSTISLWKNPFEIINKLKSQLKIKGKILIFDAFNNYDFNTKVETEVFKNLNNFKLKKYKRYFYCKSFFKKKINFNNNFTLQFHEMRFNSSLKKKKTNWNESYPVKVDNKIKYLLPNNYLLDQYILEIKKN